MVGYITGTYLIRVSSSSNMSWYIIIHIYIFIYIVLGFLWHWTCRTCRVPKPTVHFNDPTKAATHQPRCDASIAAQKPSGDPRTPAREDVGDGYGRWRSCCLELNISRLISIMLTAFCSSLKLIIEYICSFDSNVKDYDLNFFEIQVLSERCIIATFKSNI